MRARWAALVPILGVAAGAALAAGVGLSLLRLLVGLAAPAPPSGWSIHRPPQEVTTLALLGDTIWTGGRDGILGLGRARGEVRPELTPGFSASGVTALLADRAGRLWAAHFEGLSCREDGSWRNVARRGHGLPARPVSLLEDDEGLLVGTEAGLGRWRDGRFESVPVPNDLALAGADVLHWDQDGTLWVGSSSPTRGGLWSRDASGWRRWDEEARLPHSSVNAIFTARDGSLWVATGFANRGGAAQRIGDRWRILTRRDGLAGEKVRTLFEDRAGRLWFGSEYDGVAIHDGDAWRTLGPAEGLAGREVKAVVEDSAGVLWLGTDTGLSRIEPLGESGEVR